MEGRRSELIILFLLMESKLSGYEIRVLIRKWRIDKYLPVSPSTVYSALKRLESRGCVQGESRKVGRYPVSTVYSITDKGHALYKKHIFAESKFSGTSYSLDPLIGLTNFLTNAERQQLVRGWQKSARARVAEIDARIEDKKPGHTYGKPYPEWLLLDHERAVLKSEIQWMSNYLGMMKNAISVAKKRIKSRT